MFSTKKLNSEEKRTFKLHTIFIGRPFLVEIITLFTSVKKIHI